MDSDDSHMDSDDGHTQPDETRAEPPAQAAKPASATVRARRARVAGGRRGAPAPRPRPSPAPVDAATEQPKKSRAGRNLPAAIAVAVALAGLIIATLFLYRPSFAIVVGLAVAYGSYELAKAFATADRHLSLAPIAVGGVAMIAAAWERGTNGLAVALLLTVVAVLVWRVADGAHHFSADAGASVFVVLYLPALAAFAVLLAHPSDGAARVIAFIATVACSDTGGYATGVLFGRHPMAPIVSKAKTWEGFAGSVLFCSVAGVLFLTLTFHEAWWKGVLFGLGIVVTATLGDLGESMIKRDLEIKDMGNLLPGHGGIMDRLDSLLPCAAVAYLLLTAFAPVA
jgi:phosphatidate cytidylyltransferase